MKVVFSVNAHGSLFTPNNNDTAHLYLRCKRLIIVNNKPYIIATCLSGLEKTDCDT